MKVAITTTDGVNVNQHFGKAEVFHVYDLEKGNIKILEKRNIKSYCDNKEETPLDHEFDKDRFDQVYETIKDCSILYTCKIGDTPLNKLTEKGMKVQLCNCRIIEIISCGGCCCH